MPEQPVRTPHAVAKLSDIPADRAKIVELQGKSIGLFKVAGQIIAVLNYCPHEGAPVCRGKVRGTTLSSLPGEYTWGKEGEILACPWHGWEFDLMSGQCLTDKRRLHRYPVEVSADTVYILL
jgi:nitrite reductase (NADH) small subunit